jgi:hypothetical protein
MTTVTVAVVLPLLPDPLLLPFDPLLPLELLLLPLDPQAGATSPTARTSRAHHRVSR